MSPAKMSSFMRKPWFAAILIELLFLSSAAAPSEAMPRAVSQLGLPGGPLQSFAFVAGVEKAPDSMRLLHASTEGATLHRQSRNGVFHRAPLGAAIAYVAILTVALLILVCARRLSSLSIEGGWVRSLAGAEGDEPAGACGGDEEEGASDEDEKVEEDKDGQWAIIQQARENLKGFEKLIKKLLAMKNGYVYRAVASATGVYMLIVSDVGALGGFIEQELRELRSLWLSVMEQAAASAREVQTGWPAVDKSFNWKSIHCMNGYLQDMISEVKVARKKRKLMVAGNRWAALRNLVRVQAEAIGISSYCLTALHPDSPASGLMRRRAFSRLGGVSNVRRRMLLANPSYARYFRGFNLKGFAGRRFGPLAAQAARKDNLPNTPEGQIEYLRKYFPTDLRVVPPEAPTAMETYLTADAPSSTEKKAPKTPQGPWPSLHPPGPPMHPPAPPPSSQPGSDSFVQLGARPKTYSQALASGEQKSSEMSSKKFTPGAPHGVQQPEGKPGAPKSAPPPIPFPWGKDTRKQPGSAPGSSPQEPQTLTPLSPGGSLLRRRKERGTKEAAPKEFASPTKEGGSSGVSSEAERETSEGPQGPDDEIAQALKNFVLAEEEESTADDGDEVDEVLQPLDGTPFDAGQTMLAPLPTQSHTPFLSSPWAAPGIPMGPRLVGVGPSSASRGGAFFGELQGLPRPSGPRLPPPPIFSGPLGSAEPATHTSQKSPKPLGGPHGVPGPPFSTPPPSPGFTGPPQSVEQAGLVLERFPWPSGPFSGPLPPTSSSFGPLLGTVQQASARSPSPPSPSTPFPSAPVPSSPSVAAVHVPPHDSPSGPSIGGPSHVSTSGSSGLGPATAGFWDPAPSSPSLQVSPGPAHPPSTQPSASGGPFPPLLTRAVSGPTSTQPSPNKDKLKGKSGLYQGMPLGEPAPSVTSVSTSSPPS
ncbi:hypothetical protein ACSSS7_004686 [Eimeria intestinalis]